MPDWLPFVAISSGIALAFGLGVIVGWCLRTFDRWMEARDD